MGRQRWDPGSLWAIEGLLWIDHQHLCVFGNRWKQKEVSAGQNISDLNLTDVDLEENYKLQEVLEEIKEEDKDIEDAAGKEVNVGVAEKKKGAHKVLFKQSVAAGGTTKKRLVQAFIPPRKRPSTKTTVVTEEELSEQMEGSGCFVFSFLISH
ncbi:hypothetical protein F2Q68_00015802 [Brassica cretica]|uniref:Uncharacterized protein n=2 Tax=Brassica cretica TaxID=69181 RepID=A0A8S9HRF5_BRACR|nr:hypothetical protein F2Q68_00015802 [Brassica cretica]KAF3612178.1 hypothetical protein DY000_02048368 [Brassica cretica]